ncbi:MAG: ROK family protein [Acholeplasmatales bacterium]|nr:ROK family protein [Acholeplasmatales bacterium]
MKFGIDIGGTTVKIGLVDQNTILDKFEIPTHKETLFEDICIAIKEYMDKKRYIEIEGLGFGIPGNVVQNYIYNMPNVGITNVNLEEEIHTFIPDVKVCAQNDANVAALGEMLYHDEFKNACMLTLGTGVGCGVVLNGKVLEGCHGAAGEVGHMIIAEDYGFSCTCGLVGCLETVASATGIVRLAKYHYHEYKTKLKKEFSAKDVLDLAKKEDPLCLFVLDRVGYYIAKCLAILAVTVDIEVFYIGGGVSKAGNILIDTIKKHYQKMAFYAVKNIRIEAAKLLNDAGMLGAAGLLEG